MRLAIKFLLLVSFLAIGFVHGQEAPDTLLAKDNVMIPLPTVSLNFGFNHLMSDVKLTDGPSAFQQFGYQLSITQRVTKFLNATLDLYTGTVYGEEQRNLTNINFRTTLFSQHLNLEYNFYPLLKPNAKGRQLIRPYIGIGVGAIFFRSKGDLKDESGADYNYWSDGFIYAESEGTVNQSEATPLTRDFEYETDLRDANLDGLRKYSQTAFSLPINAGIRFQITKNIGVNAAFAYAFNFNDMLDNVSERGNGDRAGNAGNDNHLFGSVGLSVFLGTTKPSAKPVPTFVEELAEDEIKTEAEEQVASNDQPNEEKHAYKNDLASISKRLIEASESILIMAESSDAFLSEKTNELGEINKRNLDTKKELRAAKKESIAILDSSMATLRKTDAGLTEASSKLTSAYTDFTDKKVDTRPLTTNKVSNSVATKIPAIESLKSQIEAAKSPSELRSILNVTSKNLTHTNKIFKDESSRMNESILSSRKAVIEARVERLESDFLDANLTDELALLPDVDSPSTIALELKKLYESGMLSEAEYDQFKKTTTEIEESIDLAQQTKSENKETPDTDNLASTTQLLKSASETIIQTTEETEKLLSTYKELLSAISEEQLTSKSDLGKAKEKALKLIEQSSSTLATTNAELNSVADNLNQISENLTSSEDAFTPIKGTNKLKSTIEAVLPRLDASKTRIQSAKTSEDFNLILAEASKDLETTTETLQEEKNRIVHATLKTRKEVVQNRLELLSNENDSDSDEVSSISSEIESLEQEKMLSEFELKEISEVISSLKPSAVATDDIVVSSQDSESGQKATEDEQANSNSEGKVDVVDATNMSTENTKSTVRKAPTTEEIENTPPKLSAGFHWADVNENGWISPDEVLHFIDLLFEGEAERSVVDIQNLIDYYFDQE